MLADVAKRAGTASVTVQVDPWAVVLDESSWFSHELVVEGLPTLRLLTRHPLPSFDPDDFPTLHVPGRRELSMFIRPGSTTPPTAEEVQKARQWTYALFFRLYGSRMERNKFDFSYLFLPQGAWPDAELWEEIGRAHV